MLVMRPRALALLSSIALGTAPAAAADKPVLWDTTVAAYPAVDPRQATGTAAATPAVPEAPRVEVDESALRYYAGQNNSARVDAEIRRLRTLYPGWEPPADLYKPGGGRGPDQPLWDLYGQDRLDDLRAEINRRSEREPGWRPPADLIAKLERKEARGRLIAASDAKNHADVLAIAKKDATLVDVGDPDTLWRIAEAYAAAGEPERAKDLYRLILIGEHPAPLRQATIQKALVVLPLDATRDLMALGRKGNDGRGEFDGLEIDILRARVGRALSGTTEAPPAVDELAPLIDAARDRKDPTDAELLGWYDYRAARFSAAHDWFKASLAQGNKQKAALGLALSLRALGRIGEAETIAWERRQESEEFIELFVEVVAADLTSDMPTPSTAERLARFAEAVKTLQSGNGAQALGWYAYKAGQYPAAAAWFEAAMQWQPAAKTAEGHLLALLASARRDDALRLLATYQPTYPELAMLARPTRAAAAGAPRAGGKTSGPSGATTGLAGAYRAHAAGDPKTCLSRIGGAASAEASLLRGWCLLELQRPQEAARAFETAMALGRGKTANDAAYGKSLAHLRVGESFAAVEAANTQPLSTKRRNEIGAVVLAQHAQAHFRSRNYGEAIAMLDRRREIVPEPRDLMTLRGWALVHTGRHAEAYQVFTLLDRQLSTRDTRAGLFEAAKHSQTSALR